MFHIGNNNEVIFMDAGLISIVIRLENSMQSAINTMLVHSSAILCRLSYYISKERLYFSLSKHITHFMNSFT